MKGYRQVVIGIGFAIFLTLMILSNYSIVNYTITEKGISPEPTQMKLNLNLYFINNGNMLEIENRTVNIKNNQIIEGILDELKNGAKNKKLSSPIDEKTDIISHEIESKVCYLNFKEDFIESDIWKNRNKNLIVWAIVNSLTDLEQIEKVQILVNGKTLNSITDKVRFYGPIAHNDSLLYVKDKLPSEVVIEFLNSIGLERYDIAYDLIDFESRNNIPYYDFHKSMDLQSKLYRKNERTVYFTQKFSDSLLVYIKYESIIPNADGIIESFGEYWEVVEEDGEYRVLFKEGYE